MSDGGTSYSPSTHPSPAQGRPPPSATQRALGRPTKSGRNASEITKQELEGYFHIPVDVAAARLGVGVTKLKAICRGFGIMRWPYRRIRRLQDLAQRILNKAASMEELQEAAVMLSEHKLPATSPLWKSIDVDHDALIHVLATSVQVPAVRLAPNPLQQNSLDHASSSQTSTQVGMAPPHVLADQVRMLQGIIAGAPPAAPPAAQNVVNTPPAMFPTLETNEMTASWMLPLLAAMQDAAPQAPQPPPQAPPSQQAPPETSAISLLVEMLRHGATGPQDTILPPEIQQALLSMLFP